ncbi:aspartate ammonia-lyase [bacterium]|nr:aspartate ammonia-lyase [bacterium]
MSAKFRTEKDSLGPLQVPADAYYGVQAARAVANFPISGMRAHPALILAYVHIKRAAAVTNCKLGMLDEPRRDAIVKAADLVLKDAAKLLKSDPQAVERSGNLLDQWVIDVYQAGAGTSFNMNTNEVLANLANEKYARKAADKVRGSYSFVHPNDHVNMAQSTNDTMPTGIRLSNLMILPDTLAALDLLEGELRKKGREFDKVITTGRTHLQDATPVTLGQVFTAFADCLKKARGRIVDAAKQLAILGLGGTAVGTGMNSHPDYSREVAMQLALQLGQSIGIRLGTAANKVEMHNSLADQLQFSSALRSLAVDLGRIANDLRLLSSGPTSGIGEINLPPVQPGSSIMPGKVNPVMLEMFNMVCYNVIGLDSAICGCAQAGQYQLNVMMPIVAWDLLHMQSILTTSMTVVAERCVRGITANEEQCRKYFEASMGLATVLNPLIGYAAAAEIVKHAVKSGTPIMDEVRAARKADGSPLLTEAQIRKAFDPQKLTQPGFLKLEDEAKPKAARRSPSTGTAAKRGTAKKK